MARVILDHVCQQIEGFTVVDDLSLEIRDKEFLVLVGPTGCGHAAILRMIAGFEQPSHGCIRIGDREVVGLPPQDRDVAIVVDLNPRITVDQNIAAGLKPERLTRTQIERRVHEVAVTLGIEGLLGLKPTEITVGQRLRVAIGRAIVSHPKAILMSQPLASFCDPLKAFMRKELAWLHQRIEVTVICATHDGVEAMALGDRVAVMRDGHLHQVGRPQEVYRQPVDRFVAVFVGSPPMNFVPATLTQDGGVLYLARQGEPSIAVPVSMADPLQFYIGRELVLGIRPEDLEDAAHTQNTKHDRTLKAKVEVVEHLGAETMLYLSLGSIPIAARVHPESRAAVGEMVELVLDMDKAHLFDKQTEKRII